MELNREDEKALYDMLIKSFFGYKCYLNNEVISDPVLFERLAYSDFHMLPTDFEKMEYPLLKNTIDSIVGNILALTNDK